jgi:hypothetical protein
VMDARYKATPVLCALPIYTCVGAHKAQGGLGPAETACQKKPLLFGPPVLVAFYQDVKRIPSRMLPRNVCKSCSSSP